MCRISSGTTHIACQYVSAQNNHHFFSIIFFTTNINEIFKNWGGGGINCTKYSHKNCNVQLIFTECFSASVVCQALAHFFFYILFYFILWKGTHKKRKKEKICQNLVGGDGDCLVGVCQEVFTC